ncbi:hypothetical protein GQ457_17G023930 [Hibiscus cannabinus]
MKLLIGSNPWTNSSVSGILRVVAYSTKTLSRPSASPSSPPDTLNIRISRSGDPKVSIVPVINRWLEEGKPIKQPMVQVIIRQLRSLRRYKHALELSEYMSEEMKCSITVGDMAVRLDLISKVRGVDEAEKYFNSLPQDMRTFKVYGALLNCYANHKCLEKAEATMQIMRELRHPINAVSYNVLLNLYHRLGKHDKLDVLMQEMTDKGIKHDAYTNSIRLNSYVSTSDIEGMERFLSRIENDAEITMGWHPYLIASNAYSKANLTDKALQMLRRAEQLVPQGSRKYAYELFITVYASLGRKGDVYRIWELHRSLGKFFNSGYLCMISSLVKLDDLDGAERVLAEWESGCSLLDTRIPNLMISAYCRKGFVEKAEAYTKRLIERGVIKEPDAFILNSLAIGYHMDGQMAKAVESLRAAISTSSSGWKPNTGTLAACLKFLEGENNSEAAKEMLELLNVKGHLSTDVYDKLVRTIMDGSADVDSLDQTEGHSETSDEESTMIKMRIKQGP